MKPKNKTLFWIAYYGGILVVSLAIAANNMYWFNGKAFISETILNTAVIFLMSVVIGHLALYLLKRADTLKPQELRKKILPGFIVFLFLIIVIANLSVALGVFGWYIIKGLDLSQFIPNVMANDLAFANRSLKVPLFIFSVLFFFILWGKASRNEIKLIEENFQYKYKILKAQVNPHFLFNSLNTLSELIYADVKKADSYIQKLSGIYRYILDNEENDLVSLEKEFSFINEYFDLQKVRDENKISLQIHIAQMSNCRIVPVSLQVLIENALKHNSRSVERPLKISILMENDFVVVSNNIQRKNTLENSTQKGLANLNERVKLICGKSLVIGEENETFTVRIPIIRS
jgi:hypothetical protein